MNRPILSACLAMVALAGLAGPVAAQDVVRIGTTPESYPPFTWVDAQGKLNGFEIELADALCAQMQVKCEWVLQSWDGIIPALQEGKIDFIFASMTINPDRKQQVNFTHFYYDTQTVIVGNKSDTTKIDFDNPDSVKGKVFGAQNATIHSKFLQSRFSKTAEIKTYDGLDTALADLGAGRVDYVQESYLTIEPFLKTDAGKDFE